jgi:ribose transport system permease protein
LEAIAAVIIGGASFFGGRGTVVGAVAGALVIGVVRNALNLLNVSPYIQLIAIGVIVIFAVMLDVLRIRLETRIRSAQAEGVS